MRLNNLISLLLMFIKFTGTHIYANLHTSLSMEITPTPVLSSTMEQSYPSTDPLPDITTFATQTPTMTMTSIQPISDISTVITSCMLPQILNGEWVLTGNTYELICDAGYIMIGSDADPCGQGDAPECLFECDDLVPPENGNVDYGCQYTHCEATYSCDEGFTLNPLSYITYINTCEDTTGWHTTDPPNCEPNPCNVTNGSWVAESGDYVLVCDDGYEKVESANDPCAQCLPFIECDNLDPPENGNVDIQCTYQYCEATYSCNEGYTLPPNANEQNMCDSSPTWTFNEPPTCIPVDCGLPDVANGVIPNTPRTFPREMLIFCNNGFVLNEKPKGGNKHRSKSISCLANGNWSNRVDCIYDCGKAKLKGSGDIIYGCDADECQTPCLTAGCTATAQCAQGFVPVDGAGTKKCQEGLGWNASHLICFNSNAQTAMSHTLGRIPPGADRQAWIQDAIAKMTARYRNSNVIVNATAIVSDDGSVTVTVNFDNDDGDRASALAAALQEIPINVLGELVVIEAVSINGSEFKLDKTKDEEQLSCDIYETTVGCSDGLVCQKIKNRIVCVKPAPPDNDTAMIGLTAGVVAFLLLAPLAVLAAYLIHKHRKKNIPSNASSISGTSKDPFHQFMSGPIRPLISHNRGPNSLYSSEWNSSSAASDTSSQYNPYLNRHSDDL